MIELEVGKRYRFEDQRKGSFRGVVIAVGEKSVRVRLEDWVRGMAEDWGPGVELEVSRSMLTGATEVL